MNILWAVPNRRASHDETAMVPTATERCPPDIRHVATGGL